MRLLKYGYDFIKNDKTVWSRLLSVKCRNGSIIERSFSNPAHVPSHASVVICGGGIIGCSTAYHLTQLGVEGVIIVEQGSLGCGTTWHSAGLLTHLRNGFLDSWLTSYTVQLCKEFEKNGYHTGLKQCGSLNMARSVDRMVAYRRFLHSATKLNVKGEFLSPLEIKDRWPVLHTEDLQGAFHVPEDGVVDPTDLTSVYARLTKENGGKIFEKTRVIEVLTNESKEVYGVVTDKGTIKCDYFVNCAGQWARTMGKKCTVPVKVPLHSCEHYYLITKPFDGVATLPVVRDYDGAIYIREWCGGILGGGFEKKAKPAFPNGIPDKFEFQLLPGDWDHFQPLLEEYLHRMPVLHDVEVKQLVNGPEAFTPDGQHILGESAEVKNYFIAAGMNSSGVQSSGGVGKLISEWIVHGRPSLDCLSKDVLRFADVHNNNKFLCDRVSEIVGNHSAASPIANYSTSRNLRMTPLYTRFHNSGAVFEQKCGYERAVYYKRLSFDDDSFDSKSSDTYGKFGKPSWFNNVKREYWACREGVGVIDMSTFAKFELKSNHGQVLDFLQYMCSNDIDKQIGIVTHTGMQNEHGGYENDCSFARLSDNHFFMISPSIQQTRGFVWLKRHLPADGSVQLRDVTSMYTAINVIGPRAEDLLSELTDVSMSKKDFPSMTLKEININQASNIRAMRLTHSGEDGWTLYIPSEYALHVYDSIMKAGKSYGICNVGYYALWALRNEKFFAYWGNDLTPHCTPLECGREYRVKYEAGNFIGYAALLKQRNEGIKKRLVQFLLENHNVDDDPWPWGGEPIYRNDIYCGSTTATSYGFTLDRHVCNAYIQDFDQVTGVPKYITNDFIMGNASFEICISGKRFPAKACLYPPKLPSAEIVINKVPTQKSVQF